MSKRNITYVLYLHLAWPNYGLNVLNITMHIEVVIYSMTVLNLHQKTDPKVQQDFKGQGHYDKVKGQIRVTP